VSDDLFFSVKMAASSWMEELVRWFMIKICKPLLLYIFYCWLCALEHYALTGFLVMCGVVSYYFFWLRYFFSISLAFYFCPFTISSSFVNTDSSQHQTLSIKHKNLPIHIFLFLKQIASHFLYFFFLHFTKHLPYTFIGILNMF